MSMIDSFKGKNAFLSNFSVGPVTVFGLTFLTAEHAYQAAKTTSKEELQTVLAAKTPAAVKKAGRKLTLRPDWEEIKVSVMGRVLEAKFPLGQNGLSVKLMKTDPAHLVEGNNWGDTFWGCVQSVPGGPWEGSNHLGMLLMERRGILLTQ